MIKITETKFIADKPNAACQHVHFNGSITNFFMRDGLQVPITEKDFSVIGSYDVWVKDMKKKVEKW